MATLERVDQAFRSKKWSVFSASLSALAYSATWAIVATLYARQAWHPGSPLHHWLATIEAAIGWITIALGVIGLRKGASKGFALAAIFLAALCLATATVWRQRGLAPQVRNANPACDPLPHKTYRLPPTACASADVHGCPAALPFRWCAFEKFPGGRKRFYLWPARSHT